MGRAQNLSFRCHIFVAVICETFSCANIKSIENVHEMYHTMDTNNMNIHDYNKDVSAT